MSETHLLYAQTSENEIKAIAGDIKYYKVVYILCKIISENKIMSLFTLI